MNIELSAAQAWQKVMKENAASDAVDVARQMVTDTIVTRLEKGSSTTFEQEVAKIHMDTDGDPRTREMLLKQVEGIASTQGQGAYDLVRHTVAGLK